MWTGWTDEMIEGTFIDPTTGEILDRNNSYAPFEDKHLQALPATKYNNQ